MQTTTQETKTTNANSKCSPLKHLHIQTCKKKCKQQDQKQKQQMQTSSVRHLNIYTYKPVKRKQQKCEQQDQQQKQQMQTSSVRHLSFLTPCRFNANKETKTTNARSKCSPLKRLRIQTCKKKKQ